MTYYAVLEVSESASDEVIRMAYKALAKKYHPDTYDGDKDYAEQQMKLINEAYYVLSDSQKRFEYNKKIQNTRTSDVNNDTTKSQPTPETNTASKSAVNEYQTSSDESKEIKSKIKIPFISQWKFITTGLFFSSILQNNSLIFIFLALFAIRLFVSTFNKSYRLHGFKKFIAFISCTFVLLFCYPLSTFNETNNSDNISNQTQTTQNTQNTKDNNLKVNTTIKTETINDKKHQEILKSDKTKNLKFLKPNILNNIVIQSVTSIAKDRAIIQERDKKDVQNKYYNLKKEKEVLSFTGYPSIDSVEHGYLAYSSLDFGIWTSTSSTFLNSNGENIIKLPDEEIQIYAVFYDKQAYVCKRKVETLEYSGYEYALLSFDGDILTNWVRDITEKNQWEHIGDGMFYIGYTNEDGYSDKKIHYIVDMFTGQIFEWPEIIYEYDNYLRKQQCIIDYSTVIDDMTPLLSDDITFPEYKDDVCIFAFRYPFIDPLAPTQFYHSNILEFYSIDRKGNYKKISSVSDVDKIQYIESLNRYVCAEYDHNVFSLLVQDMYGNTILNLTDCNIEYYELGENYITVKQMSKSGSAPSYFYSFYDYYGNEIHEPFNIGNKDIKLLEKISCYALLDKNGIKVYDMADSLVYEFSPLEVKEPGFIGNTERTYYPINIKVYDEYYVVQCSETENYKYRAFIGKIEYSELNLYENADNVLPRKNNLSNSLNVDTSETYNPIITGSEGVSTVEDMSLNRKDNLDTLLDM